MKRRGKISDMLERRDGYLRTLRDYRTVSLESWNSGELKERT